MNHIALITDDLETSVAETWARILTRTSQRLVDTRSSASIEANTLSSYALVVLASASAPEFLRAWEDPVLVMHPHATFDMGMSGGRPDADYGYADDNVDCLIDDPHGHFTWDFGTTLQLCQPEASSAQIGWAVPASYASPIIRAPSETNEARCVAFAYNRHDVMPGLRAPGPRAAFYLPLSSPNTISHEAERLFGRIVAWLLQGSGTGFLEPPQWLRNSGAPTHTLSQFEYRNWVLDQVATRLWRRMLDYLLNRPLPLPRIGIVSLGFVREENVIPFSVRVSPDSLAKLLIPNEAVEWLSAQAVSE